MKKKLQATETAMKKYIKKFYFNCQIYAYVCVT